MVLAFPGGTEVNGAVVSCYPEVPISQFNHAADVDISEDEAEDLLEAVTRHFVSRRSPDVRFRTTALTRPRSFSAFLQNHGFARSLEDEESAMVFKGKDLEDKLSPNVNVKEISESEVGVYSKLLLTIFEMPFEWKKGVDTFILEIDRSNIQCWNVENVSRMRHRNNYNSVCRNGLHQRRQHTSHIIHGKERKPRTALQQDRVQNRSYICLVRQAFEQSIAGFTKKRIMSGSVSNLSRGPKTRNLPLYAGLSCLPTEASATFFDS
jgi:hypothetical protein